MSKKAEEFKPDWCSSTTNTRKSSWKKVDPDNMKELIEKAWEKNKDKIMRPREQA